MLKTKTLVHKGYSFCSRSALLILLSTFVTSMVASNQNTFDKNELKSAEKHQEKANLSTISERRAGKFVLVIEVTKALHITQPRFLSVTISGGRMKKGRKGFDFRSKKLQNLAAELSPLYVRFGGTLADFLIFDPDGTRDVTKVIGARDVRSMKYGMKNSSHFEKDLEGNSKSGGIPREHFSMKSTERRSKREKKKKFTESFIMTGLRWDNLTKFCDKVGWDIMWDLNLFHFKDGRWDPSYARKFLEYSASRGVRIPAFQLGNEPNLYEGKHGGTIKPGVLAQGFLALRDLISEMPQYDASRLYGPDVTNLDSHNSARKYLAGFLKKKGCEAITEVSLHHYYLKGDIAKKEDFTDLQKLETLRTLFEYAHNITSANCRVKKPIRLTETSSATKGGVEGLSNAFIAGFMWLDKLGLAATFQVTHVHRQTFFGSRYALIAQDLEPNPDYYLSVMFKRLVEGPVLKVITDGMSPLIRVYAHCVSKKYYKFPDGALVVYYLNLAKEQTILTTSQFQDKAKNNEAQLSLFMFTPGDRKGLLSRKVKLNGNVLEMNGDDLPKMDAMLHIGDVPLTPESYGFVVIPYAEVPLCKHYHRTLNF